VQDWPELLREYMTMTGTGDYSMFPPNQPLFASNIIANRLNPSGLGTVVIAIDCSGSMDRDKLDQVLTNAEAIVEGTDYETVRIVSCSTRIRFDREFSRGESFDLDGFVKGGGTDFRPVFDLLENDPPNLLVYFTDMAVYPSEAPADDPGYPVIWACTDHRMTIRNGDFVVTEFDDPDHWFIPVWGTAVDLDETREV
jgi:predicted metal-dependent peptidase